jgi:hypothetical protein
VAEHVSDVAHLSGQRAAAEYLRELLLKPGQYRDTWQRHVIRPRDDVINQLAVAEVIAENLPADRNGAMGLRTMPYQLRETVSGALSGRQLSRTSLQLFVDAFRFSEDEAARLWRLWNGTATIRVLSGRSAVSAHAEQEILNAIGPRRHQTLSMHDHVYVGMDGRIERARIMQVIEAIDESVDRIPFLADTNVLTIEVGQGCLELAHDVRQVRNGVFAAEIVLPRTLALGETTALEYWCTYRYPGDLTDPQEREWRRGVVRQVSSYDMRVEFHPDRLPERLMWATWDGTSGDVIAEQEVSLDSQYSAHRYLKSLEKTIAGFHWDWARGSRR